MILSVENLSVSIGGARILRGVRLQIGRGQTMRLAGRNGAGKTTLMRSIMGLINIAEGKIFLGDVRLDAQPPDRRAGLGIGYMPEDRRLVPDFTAEENILLPAWTVGETLPLDKIYALIPEVSAFASRKASELSGGQQKLVALARALACGSRLLLLDEPFEGVAPALSRRLAEIISRAQKDARSVLIAESDQSHSEQLVDHSLLIERGAILDSSNSIDKNRRSCHE